LFRCLRGRLDRGDRGEAEHKEQARGDGNPHCDLAVAKCGNPRDKTTK
jgi:hypothetical protein